MRIGLDIGSTTIKCVVLNEQNEIVYSTYERHLSHILEKGEEILTRVDSTDGQAFLRTAAGQLLRLQEDSTDHLNIEKRQEERTSQTISSSEVFTRVFSEEIPIL